ncbi:MAG: HalD/BesD family halogenase [Acidimicrobiia bacterium]
MGTGADGHALDLVDLATYPIDRPESEAYAALARQCQEQLARTGASILRGFLRPEALDRALESARTLTAEAHRSEIANGSPYLELPDDHWPEGHPRLMHGPTSLEATAYDRFPPSDPIRRLYESDRFMEFLAAALGRSRLYRYDDPLGALNLAVMTAGDQLWWHFDQTDFVVSIALQSSDAGGDFECVPMLRSPDDERYDAVARVLTGADEAAVRVPMEPGTLMLFQGRHSLHRVTPIEGEVPRLVALLAYDTKPGTCSSELLRAFRYGRTESLRR